MILANVLRAVHRLPGVATAIVHPPDDTGPALAAYRPPQRAVNSRCCDVSCGQPPSTAASPMSFVVAALYHFARLDDAAALRAPLLERCLQLGLRGTLLLATEGINGTIAGTREGIDTVLAELRSDARLAKLEHKESLAEQLPFQRMKVKFKPEIVTMGVPDTDPTRVVGSYLDAEQWNALISTPGVRVVDTRNQFEVDIGSFVGAVSPRTNSFREFPAFVEAELAQDKTTPVAMFCTGGIRCEKATSYLRAQGFENVFHLRGGILKYLETVNPQHSLWQGECFVFDERVSVDAQLRPGRHHRCPSCGRALAPAQHSCVCGTPPAPETPTC